MFVRLRTDKWYAVWKKLGDVHDLISALENAIAESVALTEIAKKQCTIGIRRAQSALRKRKIPYYKGLLAVILFLVFWFPQAQGQEATDEESYVLDVSTSIGQQGSDLFQEYLRTIKHLLATEPPNTRVWVSIIGNDPFAANEILRERPRARSG